MNTTLKFLFVIPSVFLLYSCTKDSKIPIPVITTEAATSITLSSAVSGGEMSEFSTSILEKGICWSTIQNPTIADIKVTDNSINKRFSINMSSLSANTVYYIRAFATNSTGTGYGDQISFTTLTDYSGQTGTINDADGNTYPIMGIGSQIWMARNLETTKYQDGTSILFVTSNSIWTSTTICYSLYNNDLANKSNYGALYNWYTIDPSTTGHKICPVGWHIPSKSEFLSLLEYLGPDAASKLRESGTSHWFAGNIASNASGFTALAGGIRNDTGGAFQFFRDECYFWASNSDITGGSSANYMRITETGASASYLFPKGNGLSIRCLKDQ